VTDTQTPAVRSPRTFPSATAAAFRHWLATLNVSLSVFLGGALAAPIFAASGWRAPADALYAVYHLTCHQWAFRSFFLFAPGQLPAAVYSQQQLADVGTDPFSLVGNADLGWKIAFCERDLAIYIGLLAVGLFYARHRDLQPASFGTYAILILPMAVDGFTQLFGWRESTWQLRVVTGLLFGLASAWLVLPRLDASFGRQPTPRQYSPGTACTAASAQAPFAELSPLPLQEPAPELSPRR
jgi:uncharacterized membrane protein